MTASILNQLLSGMLKKQASDLHLSCNRPPALRVDGALEPFGDILLEEQINVIVETLLDEKQQQLLLQLGSFDIGYSLDSGSEGALEKGERFRINLYSQRNSYALAIRWLDGKFRSFEELSLPNKIRDLTELTHGLVLVTGATGSGKSTTLASIIHKINQDRPCHILTLEDPIEFVHVDQMAMVHQRELHVDFPDFAQAIRNAMREDPDVILLGEMRDQETMRTALMAAETGHLVFSTLHTNEAIGVLDRIIANFSGGEQNGIRQQLSQVLRAVVTQTLVPRDDGVGRVPINEILMVNAGVSHLIRSHKPEQIRSMMETGSVYGMQTFERALADRVKQSAISIETAKRLSRDSHAFERQLSVVSG